MKQNAVPLFLLTVLAWLCPLRITTTILAAADEPAAAAASKRGAALRLACQEPTGEIRYSQGAFVSADGLALVSLLPVAVGNPLTVTTSDDKELPFGAILGIFPEQELALIKFNHRPKVWLTPAAKEPETGESLAIALRPLKEWKTKVKPLTGPIVSKRSSLGGNLLEDQFVRVLSFGAGLTVEQRSAMNVGCFAVNAQGELAAVVAGLKMEDTGQKLILLTPLTGLAKQITAKAKEAKAIPWPLPPDQNPVDPALLDRTLEELSVAERQGDRAEGLRLLDELRQRYPSSARLISRWPDPGMTIAGKPVTQLTDIPRLDAKATPAAQFKRLQARALLLEGKNSDLKAALQEMTDALPLCPADFPDIHLSLASLHLQLSQAPEAEAALRKALALAPESTVIIEALERLLTRQNRLDEARAFTDRLYETEKLYRAKY